MIALCQGLSFVRRSTRPGLRPEHVPMGSDSSPTRVRWPDGAHRERRGEQALVDRGRLSLAAVARLGRREGTPNTVTWSSTNSTRIMKPQRRARPAERAASRRRRPGTARHQPARSACWPATGRSGLAVSPTSAKLSLSLTAPGLVGVASSTTRPAEPLQVYFLHAATSSGSRG